MQVDVLGRTALVSGASRGIGAAVAIALLREGVSVVASGRDLAALDQLQDRADPQSQGALHVIPADIATRDGVEELVDRTVATLGEIDILVNCAGNAPYGTLSEISDADWIEGQRSKPLGYIRLARAALPHMPTGGNGRIISIAGHSAKHATANQISGAIANATILTFTKAFALECAPLNILVNAISPGPVETRRWKDRVAAYAEAHDLSREEALRVLVAEVPLRRAARPEEIADLVVFLSSSRAAFMTGTCLYADGGKSSFI